MKNMPSLLLLCLLLGACESTVLESGGTSENPLVAPRAVQVTALNASLMANWTRVAAAQQYDPTYEIWYGTEPRSDRAQLWGTVEHNDSNLVSVIIEGLTNDVVYYVWVKAVYGELGASNFCPMSYGIPVPPPEQPAPAVAGGEGLLEVSWAADSHAYFYEVYYLAGVYTGDTPVAGAEKTMTAEASVRIGGVETRGMIITGLADTPYTVWVKAANTAGESAYARAEGRPQTETAPPETPSPPELTPGNKKLTLTWPASPRAAGYKLYYSAANRFSSAELYADSIKPVFGTVREELILPTNNQTYYVWITAYNSQGDSEPSQSAGGKPAAPVPIDFTNVDFTLGMAQAEYVFSEVNPPGPFNTSGKLWDRLTRRKETALGNLFCDGSAWFVRTHYNETFDFVFLNGGYLDQPLGKGTVTVGAIESIPPPNA